MRIAHIITRMIVGGAQENTLFNCVDLVEQHGDQVLLITGPALGPEGDLLEKSGTDFDTVAGPGRAGELSLELIPDLRRNIHPLRDWKASSAIRTTLKRFRPDVVHTHSAKAGLLGRKEAWSLNVPAVIHSVHGAPFHDYQSTLAREFFRRCERWAARRCHHMICVADAMTELMTRAGVAQATQFTTVHSGMDVDPFLQADEHRQRIRNQLGFRPSDVVIGKIARLFHLKGHDDLITAAAEVVKQHDNVRFLLLGDGILRESLQARIATLGLSDHFVFAGLVAPNEVSEYLGAMDAVVHTSYREGLARALPQALIAGKPAISYDIDGAREVVIDDETGYLVPPKNCAALATAIAKVVPSGELRKRLGREGRRRFTEQFRHQVMTRRIREIYESVLAENS